MWIANSWGRRFVQLAFLVGDVCLLALCIWVVHSFRFHGEFAGTSFSRIYEDPNFWVIQFFVVLSLYVFDLYEPRWWRVAISSRTRVFFSLLLTAGLSFSFMYFTASPTEQLFGRGVFLGSLFLFMFFAWLNRYVYSRSQHQSLVSNKWLLISSKKAYERIQSEPSLSDGFGEWKWFDNESAQEGLEQLKSELREKWTGVLVEGKVSPELGRVLMATRFEGARIMGLKLFYENFLGKVPVESIDNQWFTFEEGFQLLEGQLSRRFKRIGDVLISSVMIIGLAPVWLLLLLLIPLESRGAAIYKQIRIGLDGRPFKIYKFRSMRQDAEADGVQWANKNDQRITLLGKLMRKTRLDELPQLINIFNGHMSFVGPRPERPEFTEKLDQEIPFYNLRHLVKPGLTGWAQVSYPYGASVEDARQKLEYDLFYIKNYSLGLDINIIMKTLSVVLFGAGR